MRIIEAYNNCLRILQHSGAPSHVDSQRILDLYNDNLNTELIRDQQRDLHFKEDQTYLTLCFNTQLKYNGVILHQKVSNGLIGFGLLEKDIILYGKIIEPPKKEEITTKLLELEKKNQLNEETLKTNPTLAHFLINLLEGNALRIKANYTSLKHWQESIKESELTEKNELIDLGLLLT